MAALDHREVVGKLKVVQLVHVGPEAARTEISKARRQGQSVSVIKPVADRVARGSLDSEYRIQSLRERDVKPSREERIAETHLVEHRRPEGRVDRGGPVLPRQVDGLATAAVGR